MHRPVKNRNRLLPVVAITISCLLLLGAGVFFSYGPEEPPAAPQVDPVAAENKEFSTPKDAADDDEKALEERLSSLMEKDGTQYSVYVLLPSWPTPLVSHDRQQSSASIIKIFILSTAYEMAEEGKLDLDEEIRVRRRDMVGGSGILNGRPGEPVLSVRELLRLMITESDNTATNVMMDRLTFAGIQSHCEVHGFTNTILRRKMMDIRALRAGRDNLTTVGDVGEWMRRLKERRLVSPSADEAMEQILFAQTDTECFPRALPQAAAAHKTGELAGIYHDAGIIYEGGEGYILVIFSSDSKDRNKTLQTMRQMAETVHTCFLSGQ